MVTTSLPFVANSGMTSATFAAGSSRPSAITIHAAAATSTLVQEKMT